MSKRVTIEDVAKEAGVSMMTVSRESNDKDGISEETKLKVIEIVEQVGYQPSGLARALVTNRSCSLGLIMPDVANPFFSQIARGAEDVAYDSGYNVFLVNTNEDIKREEVALNSLLEKQVDGAIIASSRLPQKRLLTYLEKFNFTVLINRTLDNFTGNTAASINVDDGLGARLAIEYFANQGLTRIAHLSGPKSSTSGGLRLNGYRQGLETFGIPIQDELIMPCRPDTRGGYEATKTLLLKHDNISAILAYNDLVATGALQACEKLGYHVPVDISIIGVDDIPLATLISPKLSTLHISKRGLGQDAMRTLIALIQSDPGVEREQIIHPTLILRETTE